MTIYYNDVPLEHCINVCFIYIKTFDIDIYPNEILPHIYMVDPLDTNHTIILSFLSTSHFLSKVSFQIIIEYYICEMSKYSYIHILYFSLFLKFPLPVSLSLFFCLSFRRWQVCSYRRGKSIVRIQSVFGIWPHRIVGFFSSSLPLPGIPGNTFFIYIFNVYFSI